MSHPKCVECLCPRGHHIAGLRFREIGDDEHAIKAMQCMLQDAIATKLVWPWCGICGARAGTWVYEVSATREPEGDGDLPVSTSGFQILGGRASRN